MANPAGMSCADCYFRRAGLCALPTETPCPTFRAYARGALASTLQARIELRQLPHLAHQHAAA